MHGACDSPCGSLKLQLHEFARGVWGILESDDYSVPIHQVKINEKRREDPPNAAITSGSGFNVVDFV
jgi:hypothetical protein